MKKRTVIILSILLVLLPATLFVLKGMMVTYTVLPKPEPAFCPPPPVNWVHAKERKLIKNGDLSFECLDLQVTRNSVAAGVKQYGGFIVKESVYRGKDGETSKQELRIRVPSKHFNALVAEISKGAQRIDQRSIEIEDVTERYIDTETRLSVKRQLETRYRELLAEAQTVKDILAIEEQLATLREDIESAEGQLKRIDDKVALSRLHVTYYVRLQESPEFAVKFKNSIGKGWENLVWFCIGSLNIWPFILMVVLLIVNFRAHRTRTTK